MNGNKLSLGRNQSTADSVSITHFHAPDECWRVNVKWLDGAYVYSIYNTEAEALEHVHSLGFK